MQFRNNIFIWLSWLCFIIVVTAVCIFSHIRADRIERRMLQLEELYAEQQETMAEYLEATASQYERLLKISHQFGQTDQQIEQLYLRLLEILEDNHTE